MEQNKNSFIIDGANPSMVWCNIADYIGMLSKSMIKTYKQRQRNNEEITWDELDGLNDKLRSDLDIIMCGNKNVQNENKTMNKKQTIRLNESQLRRIVKESVKMVLNEQYGVDFEDTLKWVQRKFPNKSPQEQEKFAQNIINKKQRQNMPKPESFNSIKELLRYYGISRLAWRLYDVSDYDRSGWDERYIATANIPPQVKGAEFFNDLQDFIHNHNVEIFHTKVEDIIEDDGEIIALADY